MINRRAKELVLRKFDDTGAATLEKQWAQVVYTGYWCIHLLVPLSGVKKVIPEGIDDVILVKKDHVELHQVKCRDESQPPWTTADVLPILCSQYSRRNGFDQPCQFHFVSDHLADSKTQLRPGQTYGQLYRLKHLLDIAHDSGDFTEQESLELEGLEREILPRIVEIMRSKGEQLEIIDAQRLLHCTWIDTKSPHIRNRFEYAELSDAISQALPGQTLCTIPQLEDIYKRILLLIVDRIIKGKSLEERAITHDAILACRGESIEIEPNLPDLSRLPGNTKADKKALFGGFDTTLMSAYALQRVHAQEKCRKLDVLGLAEQVMELKLDLITIQTKSRLNISQKNSDLRIGPAILRSLESKIPSCINRHLPNIDEVDESFCYGLLWLSTNECYLWWHGISK